MPVRYLPMRYEELPNAPTPADNDFAWLYCDDGNPVRDHFVCYRISGGAERPRRYAVAHMASEDTDFYDCRAAPPLGAGVYRVHGSERTRGHDQDHIMICFAHKVVEFTGESFGISDPIAGSSAAAVLAEYVRQPGVGR